MLAKNPLYTTDYRPKHLYTYLLETHWGVWHMGYEADGDEFRLVSVRRKSLPKTVRQEFRTETGHIIRRLKFLLPNYRMRVGAARYARDKKELALLTACCNDDLLDIYALEQLLTDLTHLQADFALVFNRQLGAKK